MSGFDAYADALFPFQIPLSISWCARQLIEPRIISDIGEPGVEAQHYARRDTSPHASCKPVKGAVFVIQAGVDERYSKERGLILFGQNFQCPDDLLGVGRTAETACEISTGPRAAFFFACSAGPCGTRPAAEARRRRQEPTSFDEHSRVVLGGVALPRDYG